MSESRNLFKTLIVMIICVVGVMLLGTRATRAANSITLAGNLQSEASGDACADWTPDCADTHLALVGNGVWRAEYALPTGDYEYKMVEDDSWDNPSHNGNHVVNGNTSLNNPSDQAVRFYFDEKTNGVLDSVMDVIAVAAGSFQSELGCPGDWQPDCVMTLLTDVDGDGVYQFEATGIPAGDYEFKVALNEGWDTAYPNDNVAVTIGDSAEKLTITYDTSNNAVDFTVAAPSETVAVAGSMQSELGCPGDWQPECAATELTEIGNGVFRGEFTVPTGDYEYKLALNDAWDEAYPANNVALSVPALRDADVRFYFDSKTKDTLDNINEPKIPVATGELQSEHGCAGDWQPDCLLTLMSDADGDGIYTLVTTALAAGDYQYKVAFNEGWGNGEVPADNAVCSVSADNAEITFSWNSADDAVSCTEAGAGGGGGSDYPTDTSQTAARVNYDVQSEVFYFVLPDRFENGDTSNDLGGLTGDKNVTGYDPTDIAYYHGGDFAGLQSRLDYISDLGVTAIWITPPYKNQTIQSDGSSPTGFGAAYHGYWILDFENADAHLGSNAELLALVEAAHAAGIKVYFDFVVNHTADVIGYQGADQSYRSKADFPYKDASGVEFDDADYAGGDTFPTLDPATSFPYVPEVPSGMENVKSPAFLNDLTNYHNRGDTTFTGENSLYGDFFGLDDLFTEKPSVVDGYIGIAQKLIDDYGIDGFRIDTVKHVNIEFWQQFGPAVMEYAAAQGDDDFYMYGEVFEFDPASLSRYTTEGNLPSVVDFGLWGAARGFAAQNNATDSLRDFFASDDYYTDTDSNAYGLGNFVSNHDGGLERLGFHLRNESGSTSDADLVSRSEMAHGLIYFSRGFPIVYYGDEQGFVGGGSDKNAREDMMPSQVAAHNGYDLIGTDDTTADSNFDTTHPLYTTLADMEAVRSAHPALQSGAQLHRYSEGGAGVYAFSRIDTATMTEYVVALNNATVTKQVTVTTGTPDSGYVMLYSSAAPGRAGVNTDADGNMFVSVPPLSVSVYMMTESLPCASEAPAVAISVPAVLQGRAEIGATLTTDAFAEVTFAVSSDGGTTYEIIGTDDNAPYRVFYDVSGYDNEQELVFQAVVDDKCGNAPTAAADAGVVSAEPPPADDSKAKYALIHYNRPAGDYGDGTSADYNDFWGLHLWGAPFDVAANQVKDADLEWTNPMPLFGEDDFGRFAWIKLDQSADASAEMGFIIHQGDVKDTDPDRFFKPFETPEIWINQGDTTVYTSKAEALGALTVHYNRSAGDYDGWGLHLWQDGWSTDWGAPFPATGDDAYGKVYEITDAALDAHLASDVTIDFSQPINFIMHNADDKNCPDDQFVDASGKISEIWLSEGECDYDTEAGAAMNVATIHYHRPDGDYGDFTSDDFNDFWGLHTWGDADDPGWTTPRKPTGQDAFGIYFEVPLNGDNPTQLNYILHRGDEKDPGVDQFLVLAEVGYEVWQVSGADPECPYVAPVDDGSVAPPSLAKARAHWVNESTIVWPDATEAGFTYEMATAVNGGMSVGLDGVQNGETLALTPNGTYDPASNGDKFPHLTGMPQFTIGTSPARMTVAEMLTGQLAVIGSNGGQTTMGTGIQIPGVLDDLYTSDQELGAVWNGDVPTLRLWAPTAKSVTLHVFDDSAAATTSTTYPMVWDAANGTWSYVGSADFANKFYLYEVEVYVHSTGQIERNMVTDPYSVSLATNSTRSQIVDLNDPALKPAGWDALAKPTLLNNEQISVYELHVRDFSIFDETVPAADRGTYRAFTHSGSNGMQHLQRLSDAGMTHLHLLPVFDIATIEEDRSLQQEVDFDLLATYAPTSTLQQEAVSAINDLDGFNWGYDPYHYTTPEGSYSTDPDGVQRIIEFREMVKALNDAGMLVVMDVVYNHTAQAGQSEKSVLDKVVPGYYHRLNADGDIETSTCCQNTASEHAMMEKLMVDSLITWATMYKVDSFRFDLMGHHMKDNMLKIQAELATLNPTEDGIDGTAIYLYGEGWNFGEVANNARGVNATQLNMAGTGIGTFSDRLRDAVRGPGPFDGGEDLRKPGFISGQHYDPNNHPIAGDLDRLLLQADQVRVGLAGNLADYSFVDRNGNTVTGSQVDYNGAPTGYTMDPQENVSYVSKHDNQTLYDINAYTLPDDTSMADRVRVQNLGLSIVMYGQGMQFFHAGSDILRSKSLDRDSFNSGDWFNRLDWTYGSNNWGSGLPVAEKNEENWPIMIPLLADPNLDPSQSDIEFAHAVFQDMLKVRGSSRLFSLPTREAVQERVRFHNTGPDQIPGLIVMSLNDEPGVGSRAMQPVIVVLINANDEAQSFSLVEVANEPFELHPVLVNGADSVVKTSSYAEASGTFSVPARTTAVFVTSDLPFTQVDLAQSSSSPSVGSVVWMALLPLLLMLTYTVFRKRDWQA